MLVMLSWVGSATLLVVLLSVASMTISEYVRVTREETSAYECGFEHSGYSRLPFSFRYFLLTMIFLVFDMEIVFLLFLPESVGSSVASLPIVTYSIVFLLLLTLGLFYEWVDGSLDWVM